MDTSNKPESVDAYMACIPDEARPHCEAMRALIRTIAPDAVECISYQMPTYKIRGAVLVHFAAQKHHMGFYPTPKGIEDFAAEFGPLKWSKGAVQLPYSQEFPTALVTRMLESRLRDAGGPTL